MRGGLLFWRGVVKLVLIHDLLLELLLLTAEGVQLVTRGGEAHIHINTQGLTSDLKVTHGWTFRNSFRLQVNPILIRFYQFTRF